MTNSFPSLTLVLGGAASGKSVFAEELVEKFNRSRVYVATAQAFDAEMEAKIQHHIARRGSAWTTYEAPLDLSGALSKATPDCVVLLDCVTLWLSNHLLADHDLHDAQVSLIDQIEGCAAPIVAVSNEVGQGIVPDTSLGRRFREVQGRANIALAAKADLVVQVVAGLPQILKGRLP